MGEPREVGRAHWRVICVYFRRLRRHRQWLRALVDVVLAANALDLSTSLLPTLIDVAPLPHRPTGLLALQLVLLGPLIWRVLACVRPLARWWARLPIPLVPRALLSAVIVLQLAHVALRMEIYPFTSVAMFSNVVEPPKDGNYRTSMYVLDRAHGLEILPIMREGNSLFARYFSWDYKAAWVMRMYKGTPGADAVVGEALTAPLMATVTYDQRSGRVRSIVVWP